GNIDPIPIDPLPLHHHIPQVDAQAKLHATVDGERCVPGSELPLDSDRTLHRIHHTDKFCQQVVTREVHNATSVLLNEGAHDLPIGHQGTDGRLFILAHQAAIPDDIGTENRRELAGHTCDPTPRVVARSHEAPPCDKRD